MSELTQEQLPAKKSRWQQLKQNPVTIKELRSRMRGRRAFVVLSVYLLVMSLLVMLIYAAFVSSGSGPFGPTPSEIGKAIFATIIGVQGFLVVFVGPAFTAGTITGEKERQTYDLLRTTLLSANGFVMGKLLSALGYVVLLILAAVPLQSIAFLLGGISLVELFLSQLILLVAAVAFAMYGLYCSASMKSTLSASVLTFAGALFITIGTPMLTGLFGAILGPVLSLTYPSSWIWEALLAYGLIALAATNLPATLIASEVFLLSEGAVFYFTQSMSGQTVYIPLPWPFFLLVYGFLAWLFYKLTVRKVRKIADQ